MYVYKNVSLPFSVSRCDVFACVVDRPLPTFLKNKKKRRTIVSDGSDVERTPPTSPTDDSLVSNTLTSLREYHNTKQQPVISTCSKMCMYIVRFA